MITTVSLVSTHHLTWLQIFFPCGEDGVHFDHLIEEISGGIHICNVTFFPFAINNCLRGGTLKPCKYPVPHQTFND